MPALTPSPGTRGATRKFPNFFLDRLINSVHAAPRVRPLPRTPCKPMTTSHPALGHFRGRHIPGDSGPFRVNQGKIKKNRHPSAAHTSQTLHPALPGLLTPTMALAISGGSGGVIPRSACAKRETHLVRSFTPTMALAISAGSEGLSEATPLVRGETQLHRASDASPFPASHILEGPTSPSRSDPASRQPCERVLELQTPL
jgi:hypothetical protein